MDNRQITWQSWTKTVICLEISSFRGEGTYLPEPSSLHHGISHDGFRFYQTWIFFLSQFHTRIHITNKLVIISKYECNNESCLVIYKIRCTYETITSSPPITMHRLQARSCTHRTSTHHAQISFSILSFMLTASNIYPGGSKPLSIACFTVCTVDRYTAPFRDCYESWLFSRALCVWLHSLV